MIHKRPSWLWPVISVILGLLWVLCVVADWWYPQDHRWGQGVSEIQGHLALLGLALLLLSRPLRPWLPQLTQERRWLGLWTFGCALVHTLSSVDHALGTWDGFFFLTLRGQWGVGLGIGAMLLMIPLVLTSNNWAQNILGSAWKHVHKLIVPIALLAIFHTIIVGVHYENALVVLGLVVLVLAIGWWRIRILAQPTPYGFKESQNTPISTHDP